MSKNIPEDYFSMTRTTRDGALSPYSSNVMTPNIPAGLHPTLSWGETPEFAGLTKTKSHSGHVTYKSVNLGKAQRDTKVYPYHTVHLSTSPPDYLSPVTPEELLAKITGKCLDCSNQVHNKCTHLPSHSAPNTPQMLLPSHSSKRPIPLLSKNSFSGDLPSSNTQTNIAKKKSILSKRGNNNAHIESHFSNSVSFDTVNLKFSDDLNNYPLSTFSDSGDDADLEDQDNSNKANNESHDSDDNSRGRSKSLPLNKRTSSRSPSRSLSPRANGPLPSINNNLDMVSEKQDSMRHFFSLKYPTSPIITHDACTITKKHKLFDDMYAGRLRSLSPKLKNRNIMCHVSGRKHTWVGIDWACNQFLEDGDTIIIVAAIKNPGRSLARYQRRNSDVAYVSNITENKIRNSPEYAQTVSENIMKYALSIINPDKIVKITVELAIGSTSDVFNDMFDLYQPSLVIIGTKPGKAAPTKSWSTKRLTDKIVVTSPVPTIIVSPTNMGLFENKLFKALDKRMGFMNRDNPNTFHENDELLNELDNVGIYSLEDQREYIKKTAVNDKFILKELNSAIKEMKNIGHIKNGEEELQSSDGEDTDHENTEKTRAEYERSIDSYDSKTSTSSDEDSEEADNKINDLLVPDVKIERSNSVKSDDDISVDSSNPPALVVNNSASNINSNTPSFKLKRLELQTQIDIYKAVAKLESETLHEESFKQYLTVLSDAAHKYGVQLAESAKLGGEESLLVRTLTGAPEQLQRTKSMVSENVQEDDFNEKLKKFRQQKKLQQQGKLNSTSNINASKKSVPKINVDSPSLNSSIGSSLKKSKSPISLGSGSYSGNSSINATLAGDTSKSSSSGKKKKKFFGLF